MERLTRKVHLDFHTSPDIRGIGSKFDKKQFQDSLIKGRVQSIVLFAKCHNGYAYYPSKIGKMHPHLNFDLLGAQLEAAREIGVNAPIYLPIGWSDLDSNEHPEWCVDSFDRKEKVYYPCTEENKNQPRPYTKWSLLCPTGDYLTMLERLTEEVCQRYHPVDGLFFDICFFELCVCPRCKEGMRTIGLNPENRQDVEKYFEKTRLEMMERLSGIVHKYNKNASVFYNGSCTSVNNPKYLPYQSQFEMEVLPTMEGSFDEPDFYCRQLERYNKDIFGMTARFQGTWGEFGTYKGKEALKCEIANCLSLGAGIVVGDHCHPNGEMDGATYENVGYAYEYFEKYEDWSLNTKRVADIGIVRSKDHWNTNLGVNSFLLTQHLDYTIVDFPEDLEGIKLLILPENAIVDGALVEAIHRYLKNGGKLLAAGNSLKNLDVGIEYIEGERKDVDYILPAFDIGLSGSPLLMSRAGCITDGTKGAFIPQTQILQPYFSRTNRHFSGHKNTPYKMEDTGIYATWIKENIVYFAHDIFSLFHDTGSPYLRAYVMEGVNRLYPTRIVSVRDFSSYGRVRLRKNEEKRFYALHLLYAVQSKWQEVFTLEDYPPFYNTEVVLDIPEDVVSATLMQTGEPLAVEKRNGKTTVVLPKWSMHALVVLQW